MRHPTPLALHLGLPDSVHGLEAQKKTTDYHAQFQRIVLGDDYPLSRLDLQIQSGCPFRPIWIVRKLIANRQGFSFMKDDRIGVGRLATFVDTVVFWGVIIVRVEVLLSAVAHI